MDRLRKSASDKVLFGVAGGLGRYFAVDPVLVRVAFIVLLFAGGSGLLLYIILAIVMPGDNQAAEPAERQEVESDELTARRRQGLAALLIIVGLVLLFVNLGAFSWLDWDILWPLVLIGIGLAIIAHRFRRPS